MKKYAIIAWPRPKVLKEEIAEIISTDGYVIAESHPGNPETIWNPKRQPCIIFVVETNAPLLIHNIIGEIKKHLCLEAKAFEHEQEIENAVKHFLKKK